MAHLRHFRGMAFAAWSDADVKPESASDGSDLADAIPAHIPAMLRLATALVGRDAAEDATQEAIMRAWQALGSLRKGDALQSWLLRITVNVCRQWQRDLYGKHVRLLEPLPEDDAPMLGTLTDDPGTSHRAAALDLRLAINTLDDDQRIIVLLRYFAEMDATEIGQALGMPPGTVRTRLRRTLHVLRSRLSEADTVTTPTQKNGGDHGSR